MFVMFSFAAGGLLASLCLAFVTFCGARSKALLWSVGSIGMIIGTCAGWCTIIYGIDGNAAVGFTVWGWDLFGFIFVVGFAMVCLMSLVLWVRCLTSS